MESPRRSTDNAETPARQVTPTPAEIARWRIGASFLLRITALALAIFAIWPLLSWIVQGIRDDDLLMMDYYLGYIVWSATLLAAAAWLGFGARRLARRLVPIPESPLCPGCGFDLSGLRDPTCPECALHFPAAPIPQPHTPSYARWNAAAILVVRAVALLLFGFGAFGALAWIAGMLMYGVGLELNSGKLVIATLTLLLQLAPGPIAWVLAPRLARRALDGAVAWRDPPQPSPDSRDNDEPPAPRGPS